MKIYLFYFEFVHERVDIINGARLLSASS